MRRLRIIPALDQNRWLVERAQTTVGRIVVLLVFLLSLSTQLKGRRFVDTAIILTLITLFSAHRRKILLFAALFWSTRYVPFPWHLLASLRKMLDPEVALPDFRSLVLTVIAAALVVCALAHQFARAYPSSVVARHPAWTLSGLYMALVVGLALSPIRGLTWLYLWAFALAMGRYVWFLAYSLLDLRRTPDRGFSDQLGLYQPFWGSTSTPFPKGVAYIDRIEAKTPDALAVSQLKAVKLIWWSIALTGLGGLVRAVCYGKGGAIAAMVPLRIPVPELSSALWASVAGSPHAWYVNWSAMLLDLAIDGIDLAIWGHLFIAIARMAGFAARRNTYKPFLATSVSEFFNRYYYYFKELLVDCFFYPIFYATFRKRFKLGLFLATFGAAGLGNYVYHFIRDIHVTVERGFVQAVIDSHLHLTYCLALSSCIFVSQVRRVGRPKGETLGRFATVRAIVGVWLVFAVLNSLAVDYWHSSLIQHVHFLLDSLPLPTG